MWFLRFSANVYAIECGYKEHVASAKFLRCSAWLRKSNCNNFDYVYNTNVTQVLKKKFNTLKFRHTHTHIDTHPYTITYTSEEEVASKTILSGAL